MKNVSQHRLRLAEEVGRIPEEEWSRDKLVPIVDRYVHAVLARRRDELWHDTSYLEKATGKAKELSEQQMDLGLPGKAGKLDAAFRRAGAPVDRVPEVVALMLRRVPPHAHYYATSEITGRYAWSCSKSIRGASLLLPRVMPHDGGWAMYWTVERERIPDNRHHLFNDGQIDGSGFTLTLETPADQIEVTLDCEGTQPAKPLVLTIGELGVVRLPMEQSPGGRGTRHVARLSMCMPSNIFLIIEKL